MSGTGSRVETHIRLAEPPDAASIAEVHVESLRASHRGWVPDEILETSESGRRAASWERWIGLSRTSTFVAEERGTITGFCTFHSSRKGGDEEGEIEALFVLPSHWRVGVGRRLCEATLDHAWTEGFTCVVIWVLEPNDRARDFYESVGFELSGDRRVFTEGAGEALEEVRYRLEAPNRERGHA